MKHRERVIRALNHEETDRPPFQATFTPEFADRLREVFHLPRQFSEPHHRDWYGYELEKLTGQDLLQASVGWSANYYLKQEPYTDEWGVEWKIDPYETPFGIGHYTNIARNPLRDNDELIEVKATNGEDDIFLITKKGMCIRFHETDVRVTGRVSMGVIGMKFDEGDEVIGMQMASQGECLLVVSENGYGKRTPIDEFTAQNRGGKGVRCYKIIDKTGDLVGAKLVDNERKIMLITNEGIIIKMAVSDISIIGRNTSGVKLMSIDAESGIAVASIAKVRESDKDEDEEDEFLEEQDGEETESENTADVMAEL